MLNFDFSIFFRWVETTTPLKVELKSLLRQAVEELDVSQAPKTSDETTFPWLPNICCLLGVRNHVDSKRIQEKMHEHSNYKVGQEYIGSWRESVYFVCFVLFCVLILVAFQRTYLCSEKPWVKRGGGSVC